jgi:hypothetical protein
MAFFLIVVSVLTVVIIMAAVLIMRNVRQSKVLRLQFGSEYGHAVEKHGTRRRAERELHRRQNRVAEMNIRPLTPAAREVYRTEWARVQERFVDTPEDALSDADRLVWRVMTDRGYETRKFQQRVADLSVEHAPVLDHYRKAHGISVRAGRQEASTEELRQAMVHYRILFEDLLADSTSDQARADGHVGRVAQNGGRPSRPAPDLPHTPGNG